MHTHMSLFSNGTNVFFDADARCSSVACPNYIGGILRHAKTSAPSPIRWSIRTKRLVPGYEAPTNIAWSEKKTAARSFVCAGGARRGDAHGNPACPIRLGNPYRAGGHAARGLDGIEKDAPTRTAHHEEHLHDEPPRTPASAYRRTAGQSERGARRTRERRPGPRHPRRTPCSSTSSRPNARSGTTTFVTCRRGGRSLPRRLLKGRRAPMPRRDRQGFPPVFAYLPLTPPGTRFDIAYGDRVGYRSAQHQAGAGIAALRPSHSRDSTRFLYLAHRHARSALSQKGTM